MNETTGHLAAHTGEGVGELLNAIFSNTAELIIARTALDPASAGVFFGVPTGPRAPAVVQFFSEATSHA